MHRHHHARLSGREPVHFGLHELVQPAHRAGGEVVMADTTMPHQRVDQPDLPPPASEVGIIGWLYRNLFSSPLNIALTLVSLAIIYFVVPPFMDWAIFSAYWHEGTSRNDCLTPTGGLVDGAEQYAKTGACWTMVRARFGQFVYGFYPLDQRWRVDLALILQFAGIAALLIDRIPGKKYAAIFLFVVYPALGYVLLFGGAGLAEVETRLWGGLFLNLILGSVGIVVSLPIGIVLALGRRSGMPVIRVASTVFIEFVRGVPLISVLFMASVMLPLFLPEGVTFDKLMRAMIGIALFSAAYMAEVVRGGLQAIPKGQYEGAMALGLNYGKMMGLIVLPQALRIVIPGIVNTFIGLFKATTLVTIIGLFDLLGVSQAASRDAEWQGLGKEGYVATAIGFFIFCFAMARYSAYLERKLQHGHKR
ncbi:MAG: amino acid ABC transporter permease [Dongiaceae bacterium]